MGVAQYPREWPETRPSAVGRRRLYDCRCRAGRWRDQGHRASLARTGTQEGRAAWTLPGRAHRPHSGSDSRATAAGRARSTHAPVSGPSRPATAGRPRANRHAVSGDNLPRRCARPSRTKRRSGCRNQGDTSEARPSDLEPRRQLAVQRDLAGAPIEVICHAMGGSKSGLSQWRERSHAGDPPWAQDVSRRPTTSPAKLSATLEEHIVHLLQTAGSTGAGPASAAAIRQVLKDTGVEHIPSRRTIYRVLQRHEKEVTHPRSMP
jgi:hypothetical protein